MNLQLRSKLAKLRESFWCWIAWRLPRGLVYYCFVRIWSHAVTGDWEKEYSTLRVTCISAGRRWCFFHRSSGSESTGTPFLGEDER